MGDPSESAMIQSGEQKSLVVQLQLRDVCLAGPLVPGTDELKARGSWNETSLSVANFVDC